MSPSSCSRETQPQNRIPLDIQNFDLEQKKANTHFINRAIDAFNQEKLF